MPSAPKTKKCRADEILAALVAQKLTKQSEGAKPNFFESILEIARLLKVMVQNIDTLMDKQAVLEGQPSPLCTTRPSKVATNNAMVNVTTGIGHNAAYVEPGESDDESDDDNEHWEKAGPRVTLLAEESCPAIAGNHVAIGRARMWILGQDEVINAVLKGLSEHTIIVNCKDERVPEIDQVCQSAPAITVLKPVNIGYAPDRWGRFEHALQMSIRAVNLGGDVVIHCRSGVHRAALVFALYLMFLKADTSFEDACKQLQKIRPRVDLHGIIHPRLKRNNHLTEDKMPWIREWEGWSKKEQYYRQIQNKS